MFVGPDISNLSAARKLEKVLHVYHHLTSTQIHPLPHPLTFRNIHQIHCQSSWGLCLHSCRACLHVPQRVTTVLTMAAERKPGDVEFGTLNLIRCGGGTMQYHVSGSLQMTSAKTGVRITWFVLKPHLVAHLLITENSPNNHCRMGYCYWRAKLLWLN